MLNVKESLSSSLSHEVSINTAGEKLINLEMMADDSQEICEEGEFIPNPNVDTPVEHHLLAENVDCLSPNMLENGFNNIDEEGFTKVGKKKAPWCIGGDFNIISNASERVGGNPPNSNAMEDFNSMIHDCNLHDIGFSGGAFTWSIATMWQRLDRFLFNNDWIADFSMTSVEHLSRTQSDHAPLLLNVNTHTFEGPYAFRFQNILKQTLIWWNKNVFGNIFMNIKVAENKVIELDQVYLENPMNDNFQILNASKLSLFQLQNQEETFWKQKANTKIILEGERNSKFFHALANKKRIKNHIHKISSQDGVVYDTDELIIKSGVDHFTNIFNSKGSCTPINNSFILPKIITNESISYFFFQNMSGLAINTEKSNFFVAKSVLRSRINGIQKNLWFFCEAFTFYVGLLISFFEDLFTFCQRKFANWSSNFLSFGGRLVLIKSVLNSIPIFLFHTLKPNVSVCNIKERMISKFFWGSNGNRDCICWASWNNICGAFKDGSLGSNSSLWAQFMNFKYCKDVHPLLCSYKHVDSLVWKRLCAIKWEAENLIQWGLGKGEISFWQDNWLGIGSIDSILNTHTLENVKVKSYFSNDSWNVLKLGEVIPAHLIEIILSIPLQLNCKDKILFNVSPSGLFTIKDAWNTFRNTYEVSPIFSAIWNNNIPLSYSILVWRCLKKFIPVDEFLWRKGFMFPSKCQCCASTETMNHIFISGGIAEKVWNCFFSLANKGIFNSNSDVLTILKVLMTSSKGHIYIILPILIIWFLWKATNESKHNDIKMDANHVIANIRNKVLHVFSVNLLSFKNFYNCHALAEVLGIPPERGDSNAMVLVLGEIRILFSLFLRICWLLVGGLLAAFLLRPALHSGSELLIPFKDFFRHLVPLENGILTSRGDISFTMAIRSENGNIFADFRVGVGTYPHLSAIRVADDKSAIVSERKDALPVSFASSVGVPRWRSLAVICNEVAVMLHY
ncbi:hypothetical protein M5K25_024757 [Dendrobium thyrsiflorum]|uniref:Reverse transcriptase zinc-binding domain-containing protein n=1 Tax=Dendrobium thyrsiflorum TaxID=117978 RepID=A0ABD0U2P7_DENTH